MHYDQRQKTILVGIGLQLTAAATILGAFFFEYVIGLTPCPLCLAQRVPYYMLMALGPFLILAAGKPRATPQIISYVPVVLLMGFSAYMGGYHAGAEWGFWPGPTTCAAPAALPTTPADLLRQVQTAKPIADCTVAAWRFLGVSLAGWNAVISAMMTLVAIAGIVYSARKAV